MQDSARKFVTGIIAIGLVTAFGVNAAGLAKVIKTGGKSASQIEAAAINP